MTRRRIVLRGLAGAGLLLFVLAAGLAVGVPAALADSSPVLVIAAHPDDETLGPAGVIEAALAAGRPVYVAVVTNGATAGSAGSSSTAVCGAATGTASGVALLGLTRERESEAALAYLGGGTTVGTGSIPWTNSLVSTHVFFLGYPDGGGTTTQGIAGISQGLSVSDDAGVGTYADSGDSTNHNCNGDYHFLVHGSHASFTQASLQGDISDVINQVRPGDIYTHVVFDGHPDHAAVARDVLQAVQALGLTTTVHGTLIHHLEQAGCLAASAWFWPNPEQVSDPTARATPSLPFLAPPLFAGAPSSHCPASTSDTPVGSDWGPWGAPNEIDPVPADMTIADLSQNHKWQAISKYHTQLSACPANVASCGFIYAFVKSDEFFWSYSFGAAAKPAPLSWPGISGSGHAVGNTLTPNHATAADGTWANAPIGYAYQWVRCDPVGELTSCSDIAGATGPGAYTLVNADAGSTLRIKVTASNGNGSTTIWSEPTDVITGGSGSPPVNTGLPVVSGSVVSGQVLSVSNGSWTGSPAPGFSYQWQRCDGAGANCVAVGGATGQSYSLVAADVGHTMRAVVTGSNTAGSSAATSAATGVVTAGGGGGGSGTFGVTSVGTLTDGGGGGYLDLSGPFAVGQAVTVSKLTAYLGGGSSASRLRGVIYADNGGAPGALVATSNELSIAAGAAAGWVDLTLPSSLSLPAGSYWLGYWYADGNGRHYYVDAAAAERYAPAAYSSTNPAPASFGSASTSTSNYSIYASYTTGGGGGSPPVNTGLPVVSGSVVSGQVLSVSNGSWTGSPAPGFSYQWQRCDGAGANCVAVGGATGQSYSLVAADVGHTMRAVVTGSNTAGSSAASSVQTGVVSGPPSPPVNTGLPVVSGSVVSGQVLSVSNGSWTGSPAPGFSYQWQRCDGAGANCVAVGGATGQSYSLVAADVGHTMRAVVTGSNTAGSSAATSAATGVVTAGGGGGGSGTFGVTSVGTLTDGGGGGYLDLSGPFAVGQAVTVSKLTAYLGGGSSASRLRGVIYADNGGAPGALVATSNELSIAAGAAAGWVDLTLPSSLSLPAGSYWLGYWYADGNGRHYYVDAAAAERYAPAAYSSTNPAPASFGSASTSTSNYSIYASYTTGGGGGSPPVNTGLPVVSGSVVSGQVLSVSNGSWTGSPAPGFSYQWQRCDGAGANCVAVGGATGQSYSLVAADVGHTMRAVVTGSNTAGSSAASSVQTGVVSGPPSPPVNTGLPVVSGSVVSGQVLSVSNGSWTGSPAPGFSYQWQRCDGAGANCVAVGGATGQSYSLVAADVGHTMRAVVTGSNTAGSSAATSAATGVVTAGGGGGGSGTFGVTSVGTLTDGGGGGYLDLSGPFAVGQAVTVSKLTAYLGGGSSASRLRGVIYADNGGAPGALVATSNELSIAAGAAAGWVDLTLPSSLSLPAGSYWLGYWYADGNGRHYYVDAAAAERYAPAAYSSTNPAPASFGSASTSTSNYSIYASYTIP